MTRRIQILVSLLVCVTGVAISETPPSARFDHLGYEDGLSSSSISSILQDDYGFMWFGTQLGLNKYDGKTYTIYQNEPFNANSLSHNLIQTMFLDADDILWIGTYGGLNRFDIKKERFTEYSTQPDVPESLSNNVVVSIARDSVGDLWIGTLDGLNRMDEETGEFTIYRNDPDDSHSLNDNVVRSIINDTTGRLWIGTYGGLAMYDRESDSFRRYTHDPENSESLSSNYVLDLGLAADGTLWLGLWGGGVSSFDPDTGVFSNYTLSDERVYKILVDEQTIWIATYGGGLVAFDIESSGSALYTSDSGVSGQLSNDTVYSLFKDTSGIVWIGTNGGGLNRLLPGWEQFAFWENDPQDPRSIQDGKIGTILNDSKGELWIGVYNNGLERYDEQEGTFVHYRHDSADPESLSNDIVNFVFEDSEGVLWIGTNEGLNQYNAGTDGFSSQFTERGSDEGPEDTIIDAMAEDQQKNLWIGTYNAGVSVYIRSEDRYLNYPHDPSDPASLSDNLVRTILCDSSGTVWIGTNRGLNKFDRETGGFRRYFHEIEDPTSLSSHVIRDIYEDSKGNIWIGTSGGGLNRYIRESDSFQYYGRKHGISDNTILGILEDERGNLWLSTRYGISVFAPETETFRTIGRTSSLPTMEMATGKAVGSDGMMFFGTVGGVLRVNPSMVDAESLESKLVLTDFMVWDEAERDTPAYNLEAVTLQSRSAHFDFEFAELQYLSPFISNYAYKLDGLDEEWIFAGNRNHGRYTNLREGDYVLRLRALDSRGSWSSEEVSVDIRVLPPFWRTTAAYGIYLLLLITLIYLSAIFIRRRIRRNLLVLEQQREYNRELEAKVERRTAAVMAANERLAQGQKMEAVGKLAGGIAHDFNNLLTAILGYSDLILSEHDLDDQITESVREIKLSGERAASLTKQLLAFSRKQTLLPRIVDINSLIANLENMLRRLIGEDILFSTDLRASNCRSKADPSQIEQIFMNLIVNSRDAMPDGGELKIETSSVSIGEHDQPPCPGQPLGTYIKIAVRDTGHGIDDETLERIYEPFFTTKPIGKGTGLGLSTVYGIVKQSDGHIRADSVVGEGTTFEIFLPCRAEDHVVRGEDAGLQASRGGTETDC
jgi:signal transduction histidine kinase/ligand-binding sensor domain-containing protein